ncbi:MAG: PD-(D/E)XK nuclease family protein, partial [Actinobacteria bacterium]|nr:PD-(D/E)XK nuclease family protein [Actinomycetota bacterium]
MHGGRWGHQRPAPAGAPSDHVVARALAWLGELHRERLWLSPSEVLERIVRDRRLMELAVVERRPRDLWRRLRFVLDQCRAWEEAGGVTLRQYLRWAEGQSAEGSRVVETVLPESDDDAVRILTVHGAKGLEFPIVVLSGLTTEMRAFPRGVEVRFPPTEAWAIKLKKGLSTAEFELTQPLEEQMDHHERLRLLYVAATRARDHLVVSVHRKENDTASTAAALFYDKGWDSSLVDVLAFVTPVEEAVTAPAFELGPAELPSFEDWEREHGASVVSGMRRVAVSATQVAEDAARAAVAEPPAGVQKDPRDIDLPPWQKGRYGTAVGRAVHGALQTIDLATGDGLEQAAAAQAAAEGVLGKEHVIAALCRSALASDIVKRAAECPHWREVYVGVPYGDGVLEGYIDLLYRDDNGLVVVDYKTDAWSTEADLEAKVERYSVQLR